MPTFTDTTSLAEFEKDDLLTVDEVARIFRVDASSVRRWIGQGTLSAVTLPHPGSRSSYRVRRSTLNRVLDSSTLHQES